MPKIIDLTGQRFGKLTVLELVGKKNGKGYYWKCQCDCGNIKDILGSSLRSGNTKSCGCEQYKGFQKYNLNQSEEAKIPINTRFGKLVVIEDLGLKPQYKGAKKNRRWYKCQCDCGNICEVNGNSLKEENKISCGKCLTSKGELMIKSLLDENNIIYNQEVILPELVKEYNHKLRFDFVIYDSNNNIDRIIEYDGRQHFTGPDTNYWDRSNTETLEEIKQKDKIKNIFCLQHNYPLVRIPYTIKKCTLEDLLGNKFLVQKEG